jgi:hypothetical protein
LGDSRLLKIKRRPTSPWQPFGTFFSPFLFEPCTKVDRQQSDIFLDVIVLYQIMNHVSDKTVTAAAPAVRSKWAQLLSLNGRHTAPGTTTQYYYCTPDNMCGKPGKALRSYRKEESSFDVITGPVRVNSIHRIAN